jgi:hypothetical protein
MATTTNYGWTTPDDTDLVKDGASAIRSLGTSVDTTTKNLNPSTTLGDIEYRSSTANTNTRLGIGSTGNVLTVSGGVPVWSAPAGGGKVLQVLQATYSTETAIATTTYTDTGLSLSITPSSATSKVLVFVNQQCYFTGTTRGISAQIVRGATSIFKQDPSDYLAWFKSDDGELSFQNQMQYLDSPATTSATTYKTQGASRSSNNSIWQRGSLKSVITLMEIGA